MKLLRLSVLALAVGSVIGCGGVSNSTTVAPPAPVSMWAGTYTGTLNFKGCPTTGTCAGDTITLTVANSSDSSHPGEFLATITASGEDTTLAESFSGNGTVAYTGAANAGPGNSTTTGNLYLSNGLSYDLFIVGTGASTTTSPILVDTITVNNLVLVGTTGTKGTAYYGTLTRQP